MNYTPNFLSEFQLENDIDFSNYFDIEIDPGDYFEPIFGSIFVKLCFFFTYMIGLVAAMFIGVVIHFERSGQAGHFRTLVNQLVTFNLDQVS